MKSTRKTFIRQKILQLVLRLRRPQSQIITKDKQLTHNTLNNYLDFIQSMVFNKALFKSTSG